MTILDCTEHPIEIEQVPERLMAMRFDGSAESAKAIEVWVLGGGGQCSTRWTLDEDGDRVEPIFLRVKGSRGLQLVDAGDYVVRDEHGNHYRLQQNIVATRYRQRVIGGIGGTR